MAATNQSILTKQLRLGVDEPLYVDLPGNPNGGAIQTTGTAGTGPAYGCFAIPPQCSNYRGSIWFQAIPVGGTVTACTFKLETSLDGGTTWGTLNVPFGVTAAPITLTSYSSVAFGSLATGAVVRLDISGLGGNGMLRMNFTTVTLGTGTGVNIFAHFG